MHFFWDTLEKYSDDPTRTALFTSARNVFNFIDRLRILDQAVSHSPGISRYLRAVYGSAPWLLDRCTEFSLAIAWVSSCLYCYCSRTCRTICKMGARWISMPMALMMAHSWNV